MKVNMKRADFTYEKNLWDTGFTSVIGMDEVGRGALAGPVVAGAAILRFQVYRFTGFQKKEKYFKTILNMGIDDSKRLKNIDRVRLLPYIEQYFYPVTAQNLKVFVE